MKTGFRLTNLLLALAFPFLAVAQSNAISAQNDTADEVLLRFLTKIDEQTLTANFTITVTEQANQPISYTGKMQMRGDRFRLNMLGNEGAYDGKTYYLFSEETNELTLSTPTHAELLEINPVLFARQLQRLSTVRFNVANKDNKRYVIDLVPNNREAGISKFTIKLRKGSLIPEEITVNESGTTTVIRFSEATYDSFMPSFVLTKPGAFVNDLR